MHIDILNLQDIVKINKRPLIRFAEALLRRMGESYGELSVVLVNDRHIRRLNRRYRKVDSITDVLAFSMREANVNDRLSNIMGDVVISIETAKRESEERNIPVEKEIKLYLVHGILHLLGYDDEKPKERKKMEEKQEELLRDLTCGMEIQREKSPFAKDIL